MKKKKDRKALFSQRLFAFLLDLFIAGAISNVITAFIPTSDSLEKLYNEETTIMENYIEKKVSMEEYVNQLVDISYDISKETVIFTIISVVISLILFVIYPFYHDGQTIGKKILNIKIEKIDGSLTMNDLLFRSMINYSIFINILLIALILFLSKDQYFLSSSILSVIQYIVLFISFVMIAFTKKRQGIHDKIVHTEVVYAGPIEIEEDVLCEN